MLFFKNNTYLSFVHQLIALLQQKPRDYDDNHAMRLGLKAASNNGLWMEFGVFRGNTLTMMAKSNPKKIIYAFDSFQGLPERWRNVSKSDLEKYVKKSAFSTDGVPPRLPFHNIAFIIGLFHETLPPFLRDHAGRKISFLHMDADLYSSSFYVLNQVKSMLASKAIIVFDELVNYPEYLNGELKALWDVFADSSFAVEVVAHSCNQVDPDPKIDIWPQAVALSFRKSK